MTDKPQATLKDIIECEKLANEYADRVFKERLEYNKWIKETAYKLVNRTDSARDDVIVFAMTLSNGHDISVEYRPPFDDENFMIIVYCEYVDVTADEAVKLANGLRKAADLDNAVKELMKAKKIRHKNNICKSCDAQIIKE